MKSVLAAAASVVLTFSAAPAALAANAGTPYRNVDHSNDAGNDTGDARIDQLNNAQLDQNYTGPRYTLPPPGSPAAAPAPGAMPYTAASAPDMPPSTTAHRTMRRRPMRRSTQPASSTTTPAQSQ